MQRSIPLLLVASVLWTACTDDRRETEGPTDAGITGTDAGPLTRRDDAGEADVDAAPVMDAGSIARCAPSAPFGTPEEVGWPVEVAPDFYFASSVWLDATETRMIVTARPRFDDGGKLYELTRPTPADPFGEPRLLEGVDVEGRSEWSGALSADGLTLYFDVARREPYVATRASVDEPFSAGERFAPQLATDHTDYLSPRPGASGVYLLQSSSGFTSLRHLPEGDEYTGDVLDHGGRVTGYHVLADGRTLYYSLVPPGQSNAILYRTTRSNTDQPFPEGRPFELEPIVSFSGGHDLEWVSEDECVLYVSVSKRDRFDSYPHDVLLRAKR